MPVINEAVFYQQTSRILCLLCWGLSISVYKNPQQFVIFPFSLAIANYHFLPTDFYFVRSVSQELVLLCFFNYYFCQFISALQRLPTNVLLSSCFILLQLLLCLYFNSALLHILRNFGILFLLYRIFYTLKQGRVFMNG